MELNQAAAQNADEEDMADFQDSVSVHINATAIDRANHNWDFNWTLPGMMRNWLNREDASILDRRMVSAALVAASTFHQHIGVCLELYKEHDPRLCANVFTFLKPLSAYDRLEQTSTTDIYGMYPKGQHGLLPGVIVSWLSKAVLYIGLLIFMCEIRLSKRTMVLMVTIGSLGLSLPKLFMPLHRFHADYPGYINQASQFANG
jgi:hypothetical protein